MKQQTWICPGCGRTILKRDGILCRERGNAKWLKRYCASCYRLDEIEFGEGMIIVEEKLRYDE